MSVNIGRITYMPKEVIGTGSENTIVYNGRLGNRKVAVKVVQKSLVKLVDREIQLLEKSDRHENVLNYFVTEQDSNFFYIALELCKYNLVQYIKHNTLQTLTKKEVLKQTLNGLIFLHELGIVHRDLKPSNILFCAITDTQYQVKISDFGFSKDLTSSSTSIMSSLPNGSQSWFAPEVFNKHYMVKSNPFDRPLAKTLVNHPYFWEPEHILGFFIDISNRLENRDSFASNVRSHLKDGSEVVIRYNWVDQLEPVIISDLHRHRGYNGTQIEDLIRAIRNKV
ncbi:unnamed protein product [Diamesa serratosioi]